MTDRFQSLRTRGEWVADKRGRSRHLVLNFERASAPPVVGLNTAYWREPKGMWVRANAADSSIRMILCRSFLSIL